MKMTPDWAEATGSVGRSIRLADELARQLLEDTRVIIGSCTQNRDYVACAHIITEDWLELKRLAESYRENRGNLECSNLSS